MRRGTPRRPADTLVPEVRALRILFYPPWVRGGFLLAWAVTSLLFLALMTYRSLHPLTAGDGVVIVAFGALMPLTLLVGLRANRAAMACAHHGVVRTATGPAMVLSVFTAIASCMCCLPVLPIVLGALLAGTRYAHQAGVWVTTLATWSSWLYLLSAILLVGSLHRSSRALVRSIDQTPG